MTIPPPVDPRLMPDRPFNALHTPRIMAHTIYSNVRDHRKSPSGPAPLGPVFIVGSPRSGTTFLGSAMSRIPGTSYQFEPVAVKAAAPYIYFSLWGEMRGRSVVTRTHSLLKALHGESDRTLIEKTPSNVFILDHLDRWYEGARFIGLVRDGRDVAASWAQRPWFRSENQGRRYEPGGYRYGPMPHFWVEPERIEEFQSTTTEHRCIWGWRVHTEAWLRSTEFLPGERRLEIRYEEMVTKPSAVASKIAEFLQLDEAGSTSLNQALNGADPSSLGRGGTVIAADPAANSEANELLNELGYV